MVIASNNGWIKGGNAQCVELKHEMFDFFLLFIVFISMINGQACQVGQNRKIEEKNNFTL